MNSSIYLDNCKWTAEPRKDKNVKISLKQLLKAHKSSSYQKKLLKTNEPELHKSIKGESKEKLYTEIPLKKDEDKKHFLSN
jgi:hypothetical protein